MGLNMINKIIYVADKIVQMGKKEKGWGISYIK